MKSSFPVCFCAHPEASAISPVVAIVARSLRFFVVAGLLYLFGPPIRTFIEERLSLMFTIFVVGLVGGFVLIKFL